MSNQDPIQANTFVQRAIKSKQNQQNKAKTKSFGFFFPLKAGNAWELSMLLILIVLGGSRNRCHILTPPQIQ